MAGVKGQRSGGHNRKPTKQHIIDGTYERHRHESRADVVIPASKPRMPPGLSQEGKRIWKLILDTLPVDVITKLDADALTIYCHTMQIYKKAQKAFTDDPLDSGARQAWQACVNTLDKIGRQFGWTPVSRAALKMPEAKDEEKDPFDEFMKRRTAS